MTSELVPGIELAEEHDAPVIDDSGGAPPGPPEVPPEDDGGGGGFDPNDYMVLIGITQPKDPTERRLLMDIVMAPEVFTPIGDTGKSAPDKRHPSVHFGDWLRRNFRNLEAIWLTEYQQYVNMRMTAAQRASNDAKANESRIVGLDGTRIQKDG